MANLLSPEEMPNDFDYPSSFVRIVELGITNLEPWHILDGELLRRRAAGVAQRYAHRVLVPFAYRQDSDDLACWEPGKLGEGVVVIHDFAAADWEGRNGYADFRDWLRQAVEDMIEFE